MADTQATQQLDASICNLLSKLASQHDHTLEAGEIEIAIHSDGSASTIIDDGNPYFFSALRNIGFKTRPTTGDENLGLEMLHGLPINGEDLTCVKFPFSQAAVDALQIAINPTPEKMQALLRVHAERQFSDMATSFMRRLEKNGGMSGDEARATIGQIMGDVAKQTFTHS